MGRVEGRRGKRCKRRERGRGGGIECILTSRTKDLDDAYVSCKRIQQLRLLSAVKQQGEAPRMQCFQDKTLAIDIINVVAILSTLNMIHGPASTI